MCRDIDSGRRSWLGGGICLFPFEELCGRPVAAADYIGLARRFHTLVLRGVPIFSAANRNEAYRRAHAV